MKLSFHRALQRLLIDAFVSHSVAPAQVELSIRHAMHRPCGQQEAERLREWLQRRQIQRLVHFTSLRNVVTISRLGLIPRDYLELNVVRLALGALFTDDVRREQKPEFSCLSITSPNYRMFYAKRRQLDRRWAVIEFNPEVLCRFYAEFAPTNAASGCEVAPGATQAERLFALPPLRSRLGLTPAEPTDPQAEVLCDSIIGPENIVTVYVQCQEDADWLAERRITARVDAELFRPRRDYDFWKETGITQLPEFRQLGVA